MKLFPLLAAVFAATLPLVAEETKPAAPATKDVSVDAAEKLLKENPRIVVLDVRTAKEFASGHLPGAKNLDFQASDFAEKVAALDAKETYLVHCAAGGRSSQALELMTERKFPSVYNLKDGFKAWEKAGKPVEKK